MKQLARWLVAFGILAWLAPLAAWLAPSTGNAFVSPHQPPSHLTFLISFAYGAVCFWLAWGVRRHLRIAWHIGFAGLVALWLLIVFEAFVTLTMQGEAAKFAALAVVVLLISLVFLYWGRRWYVQRKYFTEPPKG